MQWNKLLIIAFTVLTIALIGGTVNSSLAVEKGKKAADAKTQDTTYKVADVYAKKDSLNGKSITVKGKVVKFNSGIMGHNWVHIQDGTGKEGTNDITATTKANVKVGDNVVATGKLAANKDFGGGYVYEVVIEESTVEVAK